MQCAHPVHETDRVQLLCHIEYATSLEREEQNSVAITVKHGLIVALRRLLRPLVRLLIKQGISVPEVAEVIKHVYVETATREFQVSARRPHVSQSRIAVLTGLTRKEVRRIVNSTLRSEPEFRTEANRLIRVLQAWHTESDFLGPYGVPLDLRWQSEEKDAPSFMELVRRFSGDMSAKEVLRELIRAGAVVELEPGNYKVLRRDYEPQPLDAANLERFGIVVRNFIQTVTDNLEKPKQQGGNFERVVFTDDPIHRNRAQIFDGWIKREGQLFLERIDDWLMNNVIETPSRRPHPADTDAVLTGLGMYHYITGTKEEIGFREYLEQMGYSISDDSEDDR